MGSELTDGHTVEGIAQDMNKHTEYIDVGEAGRFDRQSTQRMGVPVMEIRGVVIVPDTASMIGDPIVS
jgi:hypothetical protein